MPLSDLHTMLTSAVHSLKPGGALIGRRLNGDHHLASVMADHLLVDDSLTTQLLASDRSFFYQEVVVGFRHEISSDRA
jgi:S-adenosylmethionine-diacylglycerol 3-amino-3-carboxypropyl transferase